MPLQTYSREQMTAFSDEARREREIAAEFRLHRMNKYLWQNPAVDGHPCLGLTTIRQLNRSLQEQGRAVNIQYDQRFNTYAIGDTVYRHPQFVIAVLAARKEMSEESFRLLERLNRQGRDVSVEYHGDAFAVVRIGREQSAGMNKEQVAGYLAAMEGEQ